jgi:hypothetical protein
MKIGADQIWEITKRRHNQKPLTKEVTPNLTDYLTSQVLKEIYKLVKVENRN